MLTTDLTLGTFNNPYLLAGKKPFSAEFLGDYDFTRTPYVDFGGIKSTKEKNKMPLGQIGGVPIEDFDKLSSGAQIALVMRQQAEDQDRRRREERDPAFLREQAEVLDEIQAKQMARAQKYGKESAFYGFMYQGLPKLMAQAAFSKYAFVPEMVKGVQDAYSRIDGRTAVNTPYMSVNPMRGIG